VHTSHTSGGIRLVTGSTAFAVILFAPVKNRIGDFISHPPELSALPRLDLQQRATLHKLAAGCFEPDRAQARESAKHLRTRPGYTVPVRKTGHDGSRPPRLRAQALIAQEAIFDL